MHKVVWSCENCRLRRLRNAPFLILTSENFCPHSSIDSSWLFGALLGDFAYTKGSGGEAQLTYVLNYTKLSSHPKILSLAFGLRCIVVQGFCHMMFPCKASNIT